MDLDWILTLAGAALAVVLLAVSLWRNARPRVDTVRTRWISWRFMMMLAAAFLLIAAVHIVNKLGFHTGRNSIGGP
ncbi:MAG: hypothetical protein GC155_06710 [Alphaproteobacteria bacterium]|nr:hypothetical protein [Alphaproteobacteria bacterium]